MSDLVTGEAVRLELPLAKLATRGLAHGIDVVLQLTALIMLSIALAVAGDRFDDALGAAVGLTVFVLVVVGYPVACETLTRGRTVGKLAVGLRVVRDDGGAITFRHALVRGLARALVDLPALGFLGFVGVAVSLASPQGKRVGDYLAGTVVIRTRVPHQAPTATPMPPQLAGWASGLDLAGLPDDLALAARQYLARYHQLTPSARDALGDRLADEVAAQLAAPRPEGTPSWAYLAAVLAERRHREEARTAWSAPAVEPSPHRAVPDFPPPR